MQLIVKTGGKVRCVYAETLDLAALGSLAITRAGHVEPELRSDAATGLAHWWADLAPVQGPRLGPFTSRSVALEAEMGWLEAHLHELSS